MGQLLLESAIGSVCVPQTYWVLTDLHTFEFGHFLFFWGDNDWRTPLNCLAVIPCCWSSDTLLLEQWYLAVGARLVCSLAFPNMQRYWPWCFNTKWTCNVIINCSPSPGHWIECDIFSSSWRLSIFCFSFGLPELVLGNGMVEYSVPCYSPWNNGSYHPWETK